MSDKRKQGTEGVVREQTERCHKTPPAPMGHARGMTALLSGWIAKEIQVRAAYKIRFNYEDTGRSGEEKGWKCYAAYALTLHKSDMLC